MAEGHILAHLDSAARRALLQSGREIEYSQQTVFHRRGDRIEDVFFPSSGVVSLLVELEEGRRAEVAMVGREGAIGVEAVFGVTKHIHTACGQIDGSGWAVPARKIIDACDAHNFWRNDLGRSYGNILAQAQQVAACNAHHDVGQRLAAWLLRISKKADNDFLFLTQEHLAQALGVQRATLSVAAGKLADAGGIEYRRGRLTVLSHEALSHHACECHRAFAKADKDLLRPDDWADEK